MCDIAFDKDFAIMNIFPSETRHTTEKEKEKKTKDRLIKTTLN